MKLSVLFVCSFALSVSTVALAGQKPAKADTRKIDRAVRSAVWSGAKSQRVILTLEPGCAGSVRDVLVKHGDRIDGEHPLINAVSGEIHSEDVEALAAASCVKSIAADAIVYADGGQGSGDGGLPPQPPDPSQIATNTLRDTLGLPHSSALDPSVPTGAAGVGVAIIDSGITPTADFIGRITNFYDFTRGGVAATPYDDYGHGTHVAGLIGSSGRLSNYEFEGVAPSVHLTGLKVLAHAGQGRTSDVI
jgi:hypothetical protein